MEVVLRLEFNHIYKSSEKEELLEYLKRLSKETIINIIGFADNNNRLNYDTFFSNPAKQKEINQLVLGYIHYTKFEGKISVWSREASIFLSEMILSNREALINENTVETDPDEEELNLFKAFLVINEKIKKEDGLNASDTKDGVEKIAEISIALKLGTADLGLFSEIDIELLKLAYVTSYKFNELLNFLKTNVEYTYLINDLCNYFNQKSLEKLSYHVDFLLLQVVRCNQANTSILKIEDGELIDFLQSLTSNEIIAEIDFLQVRNHPLFQLDESTYSIIEPFFVLDKFTKSVKFILKKSYEQENGLDQNDRSFFSFYNKIFAEEFLMTRLLDYIFAKQYFIKLDDVSKDDNKPDYYIRNNSNIFVFEYKDVLINKEIKTSGNYVEIRDELKNKFLCNSKNSKPVGIGQLINHIKAISDKSFAFDGKINHSKKHTVYPILLLSDRLLEIPGINYIMNKWLREELPEVRNNLFVKDFILADIDTLIFYSEYLKSKDRNFRDRLDDHINKMKKPAKGYGKTNLDLTRTSTSKISKKLAPFSSRFSIDMFDRNLFIDKFSHLIRT